nr:Sec-independent protein translocase protein TatB [Novosphingobium panipatense]
MFDIGASELLMIVIVAVVVIGPKDMPLAMRTAGRWIGKMRKISGHFRAGIDAMVREAELEEMERKWREQNEAIMKANPVLPDLNQMGAPTGSEAGSIDSAAAQVETAPAAEGEVASSTKPATQPSSQAELHLPPPPP